MGRGFAVDIEDRGLGIPEEKLAEINHNLAHPPPFDLSGSDQLGLFVAGQLAKRHQIQISLRPSPYGGTTAIVLIPLALIVDDGDYELEPGSAAERASLFRPDGTPCCARRSEPSQRYWSSPAR